MSHLVMDIVEIEEFMPLHELLQFCDILCEKLRLTVINRYHYRFGSEYDVTISYTLAESHFTINTFREYQGISIDLYTCRKNSENMVHIASEMMLNKFGGIAKTKYVISRFAFEHPHQS